MTPNELLLWLSARKEGSWLQFRTAVDALELAERADAPEEDAALPLHQRIRYNLERLGHLEFDAAGCEDGWRVVPPALAISQYGNKTTGVLCGARTPKLLERIERAAGGLTFERVPAETARMLFVCAELMTNRLQDSRTRRVFSVNSIPLRRYCLASLR